MATEREFLVSKGLAKEGRGRFSAGAKAALEQAKRNGMKFDMTAAELAKQERQSKPKKAVSVTPVALREIRPSQDNYNAKAVRSWGEQVGMIERGRRGKLPTAVINAYLAANKTQKTVTVKKVSVKRSAVRSETVGYTYAKRRDTDPAFISEPLVAVMTCGICTRGVSFCGCQDGPSAPKYLGGGILLLSKPAK